MFTILLLKFPWLKYWREIIVIVFIITTFLLLMHVQNLNDDIEYNELAYATVNAEYSKCETDKTKSREISDALQVSNDKYRNQLNRLRGQTSQCIQPTSSGSGYNVPTTEGKLPRSNGISSQWLFEFAGRAEETRLKLIGCQSFVKDICER